MVQVTLLVQQFVGDTVHSGMESKFVLFHGKKRIQQKLGTCKGCPIKPYWGDLK